MDLLDLDLTPAKPAGYAPAAAAPVVDTSAWGAWWDEVLMLERFARKHQQKDISYLNFNKLSRFYMSICLCFCVSEYVMSVCQGGLAWTGMTSRTREKRVCIAGLGVQGVKSGGFVGHSAFEP